MLRTPRRKFGDTRRTIIRHEIFVKSTRRTKFWYFLFSNKNPLVRSPTMGSYCTPSSPVLKKRMIEESPMRDGPSLVPHLTPKGRKCFATDDKQRLMEWLDSLSEQARRDIYRKNKWDIDSHLLRRWYRDHKAGNVFHTTGKPRALSEEGFQNVLSMLKAEDELPDHEAVEQRLIEECRKSDHWTKDPSKSTMFEMKRGLLQQLQPIPFPAASNDPNQETSPSFRFKPRSKKPRQKRGEGKLAIKRRKLDENNRDIANKIVGEVTSSFALSLVFLLFLNLCTSKNI